MAHTYKKIIISRTDKIGDLILSIPSFFMVRKMYPDAEITVLVKKYNSGIVKNIPYIDRVIEIDDYSQEEIRKKIAEIKADIFVSLYVDNLTLELVRASKAKVKVGPFSKLKSFFVFNSGVLQKRSKSIKNEAEYNLDLIRKIDKKLFDERYEVNTKIYLNGENLKVVSEFFDDNEIDKKVLVVNPFMGGSAKNITDDQYSDIIRQVIDKEKGVDVVITCHITDKDRGILLIEKIARKRVFLFANEGELLNIGAVINRAKVYFGGSTGPTHMAGALQKSIVAIYPKKPTQSPIRWGVFGDQDVTYIIPDEKGIEDYKHKNFDSYNKNIERNIVMEIIKKLER